MIIHLKSRKKLIYADFYFNGFKKENFRIPKILPEYEILMSLSNKFSYSNYPSINMIDAEPVQYYIAYNTLCKKFVFSLEEVIEEDNITRAIYYFSHIKD